MQALVAANRELIRRMEAKVKLATTGWAAIGLRFGPALAPAAPLTSRAIWALPMAGLPTGKVGAFEAPKKKPLSNFATEAAQLKRGPVALNHSVSTNGPFHPV